MRPTVAIYLRTYLGASMTFVHRQRAGVAERFRPLVWCNRLGPGKPPHDGIEVLPQTLPVRATRWLRRRAGGAWSRLSPGEIAQWQRRGEAEGSWERVIPAQGQETRAIDPAVARQWEGEIGPIDAEGPVSELAARYFEAVARWFARGGADTEDDR